MTDLPARGLLLVLSGPSGVGKTTVAKKLLERPGFARAVTATTRAPRAGEVDGVDYRFLSGAAFREGVRRGEFLEHAEVHGRLYGTPRAEVERVLARGGVCVLVIDVQGAAALRGQGVEGLYLFLAPPDDAELERRLRARATDDPDEVERRLATARAEMARRGAYDAVVINEDIEGAVRQIVGLVHSRRPR